MATSGAESKLIKPFMHSLFHLAMVKTATPFYNEFDIETLQNEYATIQLENSADFSGSVQQNLPPNRAKENLLLLPPSLRQMVLKAAMGMHFAVELWNYDHSSYIILENDECDFCWRYDGTIDRTKTAQKLVLNANVNIRHRFNIACLYCLKENVKTLWVEMQRSDEMENFDMYHNSMASFWVRWLRERSRVPWLQAAKEYLEDPIGYFPSFSSFFTLLQPEDRERFLSSFDMCAGEDIRFCLYSATEEEEEQILKVGIQRLLYFHLHWPMQSFFLEIADKLWSFIESNHYRFLLDKIWIYYSYKKDFDYCQLYVDFFNRSPQHLKDSAEDIPPLREQINSVFNEMNLRTERQSNSIAI